MNSLFHRLLPLTQILDSDAQRMLDDQSIFTQYFQHYVSPS
jgi:hypothetical protein